MKLCKDCKFSTPRYAGTILCLKPENIIASLIDGILEFDLSCSTLRESETRCGPDARWFEDREGQ